MTTTERPTTTEVPAWLNLDALGIAPHEFENVKELTLRLRELVSPIVSIAAPAKELLASIEAKMT